MGVSTDNLGRILERNEIRRILDRLTRSGFPAWVVGGAVRDALLGRDPGDVDILTRADGDTIERLFPDCRTRQVGRTFAVTLVDGVEVASCRGQKDDFPVSDLGMRDFTINSMAWEPLNRTLWDPFGGRRDLEDHVIRFTLSPEDRIHEDPLRMVRACRFAARHRSRIEDGSLAAIRRNCALIATRSAPERIRIELMKAMSLDRPSLFFRHLKDTGLLALILPCLDRCHGLDGGPFHGETVFDHNLLVGDALPAGQPLLRLAGFVHDTGKFDAARIKDGRLTFAGHETRGEALVSDLARLRFSNAEIRYVAALVRAHMRPLNQESSPKAVRRLLAMLDDLDLSYRDFLRLRIADKKGNLAKSPYTLSDIRLRLKKILDTMAGQGAFKVNDLDISGRDIQEILGQGPGPRIGEIKARLLDRVLEDPGLNRRHKLTALVREMAS